MSIWVYRVNRATEISLTERLLSDFLKCLLPEKLEVDSQCVDLHIDQIWNSHREQDPSLTFRLILACLLHAQEEIETKRGKMILLRALGQLGQL